MTKTLNHRTRRYYVACLFARSAALIALVAYALAAPDQFITDLYDGHAISPITVCWLLLMLSMIVRLFPSPVESLGCQKAFARRFHPSGQSPSKEELRFANKGALIALLFWVILNSLFFIGHHTISWMDDRFMVCLAAFYGVCDIICILFFCPFQAWMMHNRCCTTCRIYDWDYLMICTPLLGLRNALAISACVLAAYIFLHWEYTYHRHKEWFFESSNCALKCGQCQEHLCRYKRSLANKVRSHLRK